MEKRRRNLSAIVICSSFLFIFWSAAAAGSAAQTPAPEVVHAYVHITENGAFTCVECESSDCENAYHAPAQARYTLANNHTSGFGVFDVTTNSRYDDETQLKAAGYLEGALTARATFDHYYNMKAWLEKECTIAQEPSCLLPNLAAQLDLEHLSDDDDEDSDDEADYHDDDGDDADDDAGSTASEDCGSQDRWDEEASLECRRSPRVRQGPALPLPAGANCSRLSGGVGDRVKAIMKWLAKMDRYVSKKVSRRSSRYYRTLGAVQAQMDGFIAGYTTAAAQGRRFPTLARKDFTLLNGFGDANSLMKALRADAASEWVRYGGVDMNRTSDDELLRRIGADGHCSAVIKLSGNLDDIWMGHTSWYTYASMTRIWKTYNFSLSTGNGLSSFSSYPGMLSSLDDFYILGDNKVLLQTTNPVLDLTLYDIIDKHSVPTWMRTRVANVLGYSGSSWAKAFSRKNSGTYNNQYMYVDLERFDRGAQLKKHMLTIVEQVPGLIKWADLTRQLERGYWPSYNVPYFKEIYEACGFNSLSAAARDNGLGKAVAGVGYQTAVRANIIRRSVGAVGSLDDLRRFMRYNDWQHDPYSASNAGDSICARFDLVASGPTPDGCTDSKVTSLDMVANFSASIINGPTAEQQPPFSWAKFMETSHHGMPFVFNYTWETVSPHQFEKPFSGPLPRPKSIGRGVIGVA